MGSDIGLLRGAMLSRGSPKNPIVDAAHAMGERITPTFWGLAASRASALHTLT
jgi:hypothetical protein